MSIYHDKFTTLELEKKASEIMESFDFESVHAHMVETNWKWYNRKEEGMKVPDVEDIRSTARSLLTQAIWNETPVSNVATGGFHAYKLPWGLELNFAIKSHHA
jgi:hypothetical protein